MEAQIPQLIAHDLFQSFRMGARRIEVLRGISMEILYGEAIFLSGASGAGKTTLLYTLAGLERPESGSVEFEGRRLYNGSSITQARLRNTKMGFVFQGYFLLPELTALENVLLPGMIDGGFLAYGIDVSDQRDALVLVSCLRQIKGQQCCRWRRERLN